MTCTGDAVIHSWIDGRKQINIYNQDGQIVETHPSPHICTVSKCIFNTKDKDMSGEMVDMNINNTEYIVTSCEYCGLFLINRQNGTQTHAFRIDSLLQVVKTWPSYLCKGPDQTLLASSRYRFQRLLHVFDCDNPESITFKEHITFPDNIQSKYHGTFQHYDESSVPGGLAIVTYSDIHYIGAISLETRQLVWRVQGEVEGKMCCPVGVTSDGAGRIYVADGFNGRVLILRSRDGRVIQVLNLGLYFIYRIAWRPTQPHLMLLCRPRKGDEYHVSLYDVE